MHRRKGIVYPRIVEEVVNVAELQRVWNCGYMTTNRIMHGFKAPNHRQKEQLSEYLGIPVAELWVRVDPDPIPEGYAFAVPANKGVVQTDTPLENSEIISEFNEEV